MAHTPKDTLLEIVAADLRYLAVEWNGSIEDDALRRNSVVLRRLVVEGELQRAWKAAGFHGEPKISCMMLPRLPREIDQRDIKFASAGGGAYGPGPISVAGGLLITGASAGKARELLKGDAARGTDIGTARLPGGAVFDR